MKTEVISFNIRCCDDKDGHSIPQRIPRLMEILNEENADLIGFQECTKEHKDLIFGELSKSYDIYDILRAEGDRESVPVIWKKERFKCLDKGYFWLSDTPEVQSRGWDEVYHCYRICTWVVLEEISAKQSFIFINTHYGFGDNGQIASGELINRYCSKIADLPIILTGDFNMNPDSLGYKAITKYFTDVNAATVNDQRCTYHSYSLEKTPNQDHIDYCFIKGDIKPVTSKLLDKTFNGKFPSDHYGLKATVNIE